MSVVSQCEQSLDSLSNYCQMLNQVLKSVLRNMSTVCRGAVKVGNIFGFLNFTRACSNILQVRWKSLWCVHREFSYESPGERNLKIGPHFPKLLSKINWLTFFGTRCILYCSHNNVEFTTATWQVAIHAICNATGECANVRHNTTQC